MRLSGRRFPDTITRKRETPGDYNDYGEFVPGTVMETDFQASVQPVALEDLDNPEGARVSDKLKIYIPVPYALAAAFEQANADKVLVDGLTYVVDESKAWRRHHTRAIVTRQP